MRQERRRNETGRRTGQPHIKSGPQDPHGPTLLLMGEHAKTWTHKVEFHDEIIIIALETTRPKGLEPQQGAGGRCDLHSVLQRGGSGSGILQGAEGAQCHTRKPGDSCGKSGEIGALPWAYSAKPVPRGGFTSQTVPPTRRVDVSARRNTIS